MGATAGIIGPILGIGASLFGGGNGGGTVQTTGQQFPRWTPEQQQLFQNLMQRVIGGLGTQVPTAEEKAYGTWLTGYEPWARGITKEAYDPQFIKDLYSKAIYPEFETYGLPKIQAEYAGPGYWGSARAEGVRRGYEDIGVQEAKDISTFTGAGQQALFNLLSQEPAVEEQKAKWSRYLQDIGGPTSPYWQAAMQMMQLEPFTTVGGYAQQPLSFLQQMAPVWGKQLSQPDYWTQMKKLLQGFGGGGAGTGYTPGDSSWDSSWD